MKSDKIKNYLVLFSTLKILKDLLQCFHIFFAFESLINSILVKCSQKMIQNKTTEII